MANSDRLLQRNKDFETSCAHEEASIVARHQVYVGMERARELGYARSIGGSTFSAAELDTVAAAPTMPPAVNQVNFNPFAFRRALLDACQRHGVALEAYSPPGTGHLLSDPVVGAIAAQASRTPAQVLLHWCVQRGVRHSPSQPTGTGSPRTAGSSTSSSSARNSRNSMPSTAPAAPETLLNAHGGGTWTVTVDDPVACALDTGLDACAQPDRETKPGE
jgi:aldo/keto reductase family protein